MDLEVIGRHALLFDDDDASAFVNSNDALVEWNSLLIDRYDVRHLLPTPLPPLKRRRHHSSALSAEDSQLESALDQERFLDLPPPSDEQGKYFIYVLYLFLFLKSSMYLLIELRILTLTS